MKKNIEKCFGKWVTIVTRKGSNVTAASHVHTVIPDYIAPFAKSVRKKHSLSQDPQHLSKLLYIEEQAGAKGRLASLPKCLPKFWPPNFSDLENS